jgi:hypothetical protein
MAIEAPGGARMRETVEAIDFRQILDFLHGRRAGHR